MKLTTTRIIINERRESRQIRGTKVESSFRRREIFCCNDSSWFSAHLNPRWKIHSFKIDSFLIFLILYIWSYLLLSSFFFLFIIIINRETYPLEIWSVNFEEFSLAIFKTRQWEKTSSKLKYFSFSLFTILIYSLDSSFFLEHEEKNAIKRFHLLYFLVTSTRGFSRL